MCLGPDDETTVGAKEAVDHIVKTKGSDPLFKDDETIEVMTEQWKPLFGLLTRPWFTRTWVIQELALAKDAMILCGEQEIDWLPFEVAVLIYARKRDAAVEERLNLRNKPLEHSAYLGNVNVLTTISFVEAYADVIEKHDDGTRLQIHQLQNHRASRRHLRTSGPGKGHCYLGHRTRRRRSRRRVSQRCHPSP